jgi:hypothetical protein
MQSTQQYKEKDQHKDKEFKYQKEYIPKNDNQVGLLIGKKRSNLINLNSQCKEKFNKSVFIMINNNNENDKTTLIIKSNSEEVIEYVIAELSTLDKVKERFTNSYPFDNINSLSSKDIMNLIDEKTQISRENYKLWISEESNFGYIYLRNIDDYNNLKILHKEEKILFNTNKNKNAVKYEHNVNIKFRSSSSLEDLDIKKKAFGILLDEMIIVVGKNKFKIYINKEENFGKIFLKDKEDIINVLSGINKFTKDDVEFIAYEYNKERGQGTYRKRTNFNHSLLVRNICNYITESEINVIVDRFVDNNYKVLMRMREDDNELNKGFCKILLETEDDCISLLDSLSGKGFHGTIWDVTLGKTK